MYEKLSTIETLLSSALYLLEDIPKKKEQSMSLAEAGIRINLINLIQKAQEIGIMEKDIHIVKRD